MGSRRETSDAPPVERSGDARGAAWMMASVVAAAAMTVGVRFSSEELSASLIVMYRAAGGLLIVFAAVLLVARFRGALHFTDWRGHAARGALIGLSTQGGFYAIGQIELATATVIFFSAPIFATLLAIPFLGERIGWRRGLAVVAGFCGVLVVMRPGVAPFSLPIAAALSSSALFALALMFSRRLANEDGALATFASSSFMSIVVSAPFVGADLRIPSSDVVWIALGVVVLASMIRNIADIQAYRYAAAAVLAPLAYTRLILIAIVGYALFGETPDGYTIVGGAIIIAAAFYIARRERLLKRQKR